MDKTVFALLIANLAYIGILPFVFFRRDGTFHLMWWMTGSPFLFCSIALAGGFFGVLSPLEIFSSAELQNWSAFALALLSVGLISFTWGTNRVPLALWHQENDAPQNIVTYGAYKRIRHPFYTSFLMTLLGAFLFFPHVTTLALFLYGILILTLTAKREEKRLSASAFGSEYQSYMQRTGRFWPKLG